MKTIIYSFGLLLSCCLLNSCGNAQDSYENSAIESKEDKAGEKVCGLYDFNCDKEKEKARLEEAAGKTCPLYGFECEKEKEAAKKALEKMSKESAANSDEASMNINAEDQVVPPMEPALKVIKGPMQCVCTKLPCNCETYPPANAASNFAEDEFGLSVKPVTCMCIKAPCNCPKPPALDKKVEEVEELY